MWVYASPEHGGKPIRYFEYQPDRKGIRAAEFLRGYHGCLVTDGYSGYDQVEGVTRCGCWAHMRWKRREAMVELNLSMPLNQYKFEYDQPLPGA